MLAAPAAAEPTVLVGSKKFTESVVLGEVAARLVESAGARVEHRRELGGTRILWNGLRAGELDVYPEYTGTLRAEIFAGRALPDAGALDAALAAEGVRASRPLGFNDTYVLGMREARAAELGIRTISDLAAHPTLVFGFTDEFMKRGEGWPSLRQRYRLPQTDVRGLDHDIAYRGVASGELDVVDLYSTDAEIAYYGLRALEDDLGHFPRYDAVWLWRADLEARAPAVVAALRRVEGAISETRMIAMNARAKLDGEPEARIAAELVSEVTGVESEVHVPGLAERVAATTAAHLRLVAISLVAAIAVAIPLGVFAARHAAAAQAILGTVGVIQTIPALALLVLLMPLLAPLRPLGVSSLGDPPAILALFLYSLLPIVRNTFAGLHDTPPSLRESAAALGLEPAARLRLIELPMASRTILAGVKTAAVINVGFATLGALVGAGGYGQPILSGIRLDDVGLILEGAVPAALLALAVQALFELAERRLVPLGLRLGPDA
ncbi:MAG TPA: glycine betaine ABC transporter substrate-binding protein [Myxococcota bacterium]|nr:glycine betaine ABC transporter substrate-binding protein [Myxococcota bacterium]